MVEYMKNWCWKKKSRRWLHSYVGILFPSLSNIVWKPQEILVKEKTKTNDIVITSRIQSITSKITITNQNQRLRIETPQVIVEASKSEQIGY